NFDPQRFSGVVSNHAPSLTLQHIKSSMLFGLYGKAPRVRRNKKTVSGRGSFCRKRIGADFIRGCLGQGAIAGFAPLTSFALNTGGGGGRHRQTTPHPLTRAGTRTMSRRPGKMGSA